MKAARVTIHGDGTVWRGSLREFLRVNEYSLADAKILITKLRQKRRAVIGGGAAPAFRVRLS